MLNDVNPALQNLPIEESEEDAEVLMQRRKGSKKQKEEFQEAAQVNFLKTLKTERRNKKNLGIVKRRQCCNGWY